MSNAIDILTDNHVHTKLCRHAVGTMEEYVQSAISKGLSRICFLEHLEEGIVTTHETWLSEEDFDIYFSEGRRLQKHYAGDIEILLGVEVGYNRGCAEKIRQRLSRRTWDHIGLSCHFLLVGDDPAHYNLVSRKDERVNSLSKDEAEQVIETYYNTLAEAIENIPCNMICHLDAALRHHPQRATFPLPWTAINKVLSRIKEKNLAVEINTSGFPIREYPFPGKPLLKKLVELEIPLKASSDAHKPERVGCCFDRLEKLLAELEEVR